MGRALRPTPGNIIYHVINRANGRLTLFYKKPDYEAFERILEEAKEKYPMRILSYVVMPNHWHLVLKSFNDGDLSLFVRWLTLTHTQRWHAHYHNVGYGHLYQGRFKSFPVEEDSYFIQLCRYVERNPSRAKLVSKAEDWQWSSLWRRMYGTDEQKQLIDEWPVPPDKNYLRLINKEEPEDALKVMRNAVNRGAPFGSHNWLASMVVKLGLESTIRPIGRPTKKVPDTF